MSDFTAIYKGSVYDVNDPLQRGRLRILVPQVLGESPSGWASPTLPVAADATANLVNDRVWVLFEGGDINRPTYISRTQVRAVDLGPDIELGLGEEAVSAIVGNAVFDDHNIEDFALAVTKFNNLNHYLY